MLVTLEGMTISDRERQFYIASEVYSPPGYSAFARLPLKFIGQTMCATIGVFAESVHCE